MDKKYLQEKILQAKYERSEWIKVLREWFGVKQLNQNPQPISRDTKDWENYVETAYELGRLYTDGGNREIGIFEIELTPSPKIEINRVKLRSLLSNIYGNVDGALIVFTQDKKWRFSYVSEILERDANDRVVTVKTEPKRYTYFFGESENCRTAADRFDKLKSKSINLVDLNEAFSVEKLSKEFFKTYKDHFEKFWKYLAENKSYYKLLSDQEKETEEEKTKPIRDFVKILLGRMVFLQFLQKKGWMGVPINRPDYKGGDLKFNQNLFASFADKPHFHSTALRTLFFETLNKKRKDDRADKSLGENIKIPYLNGGLFDKDISAEHAIDFPAEYFRELLDFFEQYNFTIDESDAFDREVGIDPEMLGHIFENLLEENRAKGAFYTPKEIVQYMCQESLIEYLSTNLSEEDKNDVELLVRHNVVSESLQNDSKRAVAINDLLKRVKICDPAIGSGAFPMGLLKEIFECRRFLSAPMGELNFYAAQIKKEIIQNNIYGVDIEPGAVDIARLRFWLSLVVDEEEPQPLPNLDYKIMQGNSLLERFGEIDLRFDKSKLVADYEPERNLLGEYINPQVSINDFLRVQRQFDEDFDISKLEEKFFQTDNTTEKNRIREKIERLERRFIKETLKRKESKISKEIAERKVEIEEKAKTFADEQQRENIRQKEYTRKSKNSPSLKELETQLKNIERDKERLAKMKLGDKPYFLWHLYFLDVFDKKKKDESGFDIFIGNPPYIQLQKLGAETAEYEKANFQTFARTGDIYCLFYELGNELLKKGGTLCYITSNSWLRTQYGELLRKYFRTKTNPLKLLNFEDTQLFQSATVEANILIAKKVEFSGKMESVVIQPDLRDTPLHQYAQQNCVILDVLDDSGWIIADPSTYKIKKQVETGSIMLKEMNFSTNYGIKTGSNEAFFVNTETRDKLIEDENCSHLIRTALRGKDITKYQYEWEDIWLIVIKSGWTNSHRKNIHPEEFFKQTYPTIYEHLKKIGDNPQGKGKGLFNRDDKGDYWWELRPCAYYEDFDKPKIIWGELSDRPKFTLDENNHFLNNTCFMMTGENLRYLLAILNSKLAEWYFGQISTSSGMGTNRWLKYKIELLPIKDSVEETLPFNIFVDYLTFLHDKKKPPINPYADNKSIAAVFEDVLNMMVYELYFEEHLKENQIDILKFLDTNNIFRDIGDFKSDEKQQAVIIGAAYSWLQQSGNPIRDRITLANIRSKDIIRKINSSTH